MPALFFYLAGKFLLLMLEYWPEKSEASVVE